MSETGTEPRPEKVAIVAEVRERLEQADAAVLTDYRGIDVPGMAQLRTALREAGGEYKIYKNTMVRFAARELDLEIEDMLDGPTAIAFVPPGDDGSTGDPVPVAKALREFAKTNEHLSVKGGLLGDRLLTPDEIDQLAKVAPRDELLARLAGGMAAPMQQLVGLLAALPRDLAYGLKALIDEQGGRQAAAAEAPAESSGGADGDHSDGDDSDGDETAAEASTDDDATGHAEAPDDQTTDTNDDTEAKDN